MNGVKPSHEGCPAWGANGVDIVVAQNDSTVSQGVEVGSGYLVGPVKSDIIPTLKNEWKISKANKICLFNVTVIQIIQNLFSFK